MTIQIKLGNVLDASYHAVLTTAPRAYDGFGTIHVAETYLDSREARLVLVRAEHLAWQMGRYASGIYASTDREDDLSHLTEEGVIEELYKRLTRPEVAA